MRKMASMLHPDGAWQASRCWKAPSCIRAAWTDALLELTNWAELKGADQLPQSFAQIIELLFMASFASPNEIV